jgi:hypothetical protein
MKTREDSQKVARRDLLKLAGLGGVTGAALMASSTGKAGATAEADRKHSGYRETEHVRTYYELAKF